MRRDHGALDWWAGLVRGPVELIQYLPAPFVTRGLDPRVHLLRIKVFLRKGWIAGSSPAMTAETEAPPFSIHSTEICFSAVDLKFLRLLPRVRKGTVCQNVNP
jgi:hypothetical protein